MKRIITTVLAVLLILVSFTTNCTAATNIYGDVNKDGVVSIIDASEIQFYIVNMLKFDSLALRLGDVDSDGFVSIMDATTIQRYLASFIDEFPADKFVPSKDNEGYYDIIVKP